METKIRLARYGAKKKPFFRIVVADIESPRDGRFLEVVGHYDPRKGVGESRLEGERVRYWMGRGARPTDAVKKIIKGVGLTREGGSHVVKSEGAG